MRKFQIYTDTSVINFLFADDAPEKKGVTEDFFENYPAENMYDTFISEFLYKKHCGNRWLIVFV